MRWLAFDGLHRASYASTRVEAHSQRTHSAKTVKPIGKWALTLKLVAKRIFQVISDLITVHIGRPIIKPFAAQVL